MSTPTTWIDGKDTPMEAFDVSVAWNDKASGRFLHALVMHRGHFTDSYTFSTRPPHGRNDTTVFRVWLPVTRVEAFKADAQPQDFRLPPQIHLNCQPREPTPSHAASLYAEERAHNAAILASPVAPRCERCDGTGLVYAFSPGGMTTGMRPCPACPPVPRRCARLRDL